MAPAVCYLPPPPLHDRAPAPAHSASPHTHTRPRPPAPQDKVAEEVKDKISTASYCKDDFFDSMSCEALEKMGLADQQVRGSLSCCVCACACVGGGGGAAVSW
jgi:hypothetical protein